MFVCKEAVEFVNGFGSRHGSSSVSLCYAASYRIYGPVAIVIVLPPPVRMTPGGGDRVASCRQNHFSGSRASGSCRAPRIAEPLFQRTLLPTPDPWFRHPAAQGSSEAFENSIASHNCHARTTANPLTAVT